MKFKKIFLSLGAVSATVASVTVAVACHPETHENAKIDFKSIRVNSNIWNSISAEKDAMTLGQYRSAQKQFDAMVQGQKTLFDTDKVKVTDKSVTVTNPETGKAIPVVFMDIDETILNNFGYQNYLTANGLSFSPKTWHQFVTDEVSTAIAGAIDFIKYVWNHGGVVMYNSNRDQATELDATISNLKKAGLDAKYLPKWAFWMQGVDLSNAKPWTAIDKTKVKDSNGNVVKEKVTVTEKQADGSEKTAEKEVDKEKVVNSNKEARMNLVNSKGWDLSGENSDNGSFGNNVALKTVMRIGDNFDDFNDIASHGLLNINQNKEKDKKQDRKGVLEQTDKLFGNFDVNVKGVMFTKDDNGNPVASNEAWSESYVLIGGNSSYGGFESGIMKDYYKNVATKPNDAQKAIYEALKPFTWDPNKKANETTQNKAK
ncbi:HAD family acid phosphatase [Mycoplasma sp. 5912]